MLAYESTNHSSWTGHCLHISSILDSGRSQGLTALWWSRFKPPAQVYPPPDAVQARDDEKQVRIAFDGDAVLFSAEAERIYQTEGLAKFHQHENELENVPLPPGRFKAIAPFEPHLLRRRDAPAHKCRDQNTAELEYRTVGTPTPLCWLAFSERRGSSTQA